MHRASAVMKRSNEWSQLRNRNAKSPCSSETALQHVYIHSHNKHNSMSGWVDVRDVNANHSTAYCITVALCLQCFTFYIYPCSMFCLFMFCCFIHKGVSNIIHKMWLVLYLFVWVRTCVHVNVRVHVQAASLLKEKHPEGKTSYWLIALASWGQRTSPRKGIQQKYIMCANVMHIITPETHVCDTKIVQIYLHSGCTIVQTN